MFTLGRGNPEPDLRVARSVVANQGIENIPTERGGNITYHGPGQLVAGVGPPPVRRPELAAAPVCQPEQAGGVAGHQGGRSEPGPGVQGGE